MRNRTCPHIARFRAELIACKPGGNGGVLLARWLLRKRFPQRATLAATGINVRAHGGSHHHMPGLRVDNNRPPVNAPQCKGSSRCRDAAPGGLVTSGIKRPIRIRLRFEWLPHTMG